MRYGIARRAAVVAALSMAVLVPVAATALAADATGCSGSAVSFNANGDIVDEVAAPGPGGTQAEPFVVDPAGSVAWKGSTDTVITDGTWRVTVGGFPFRSGDFANDDGVRKAAGIQEMSALPGPVQALLTDGMKVPVAGSVTGSGGSCTAEGYITGTAAWTGSPVFWAGSGITVLSLLLFVWLLVGTTAAPLAGAPSIESVPGAGVTS
jgi:hypothetical protein